MSTFHLITWKEFEKRKLIDKQELIDTTDVEEGLAKIKEMNNQKRLTTTDYRSYNLTQLFRDNSLSVVADVKTS